MRAIALLVTALSLISLTACGNVVRGFIFTPERAEINPTEWSDQPAQILHYTTPDGLRLQGWYWPYKTPADTNILL